MTTTYSSKSNAVRGAKRLGIDVEQHTLEVVDGKFVWVPIPQEPEPQAEVVGQVVRSYKEMMRVSPRKSVIEKPVEFVWTWLAEHKDLTRKEATAALVALGVNYSTARTQYQRWFSASKVKKIGIR